MALTDGDGSGMVMPIAPMNNGGFGSGFGGDGWWVILLFLLLIGNNGWGNGFGGNGDLYPWMNQAELTNGGFQNSMLNDNITSIRDGVQGISTQLCNSFANVETAANARQMANMQQGFDLSTQLANCCCENRLASADLKYTIATENCADRQALNDGVQKILDQLCQDKIDAKNDTIAQLRQELIFARGQASQDVQTAELRANNAVTANELLNEMRSCPIPAQPVYGSQPIFTCNGGCNCGN